MPDTTYLDQDTPFPLVKSAPVTSTGRTGSTPGTRYSGSNPGDGSASGGTRLDPLPWEEGYDPVAYKRFYGVWPPGYVPPGSTPTGDSFGYDPNRQGLTSGPPTTGTAPTVQTYLPYIGAGLLALIILKKLQ